MESKTYIYALVDPCDRQIRYVGKTTGLDRRLRRHRSERGGSLRHRWLGELRELGLCPEAIVLEEDPADWETSEQDWIARLRESGHPLLNINAGGTGAQGFIPNEVTRARISAGVKRAWEKCPRKLSKEHIAKIAATRKGYRHSAETRQKIAAAITGIKRSPETRKRISDAKSGYSWGNHSEASKAVMREQKLGSKNPNAKLNERKAEEIRQRYVPREVSLSMLAAEYGVDIKQIHRIVRGEAWVRT